MVSFLSIILFSIKSCEIVPLCQKMNRTSLSEDLHYDSVTVPESQYLHDL